MKTIIKFTDKHKYWLSGWIPDNEIINVKGDFPKLVQKQIIYLNAYGIHDTTFNQEDSRRREGYFSVETIFEGGFKEEQIVYTLEKIELLSELNELKHIKLNRWGEIISK